MIPGRQRATYPFGLIVRSARSRSARAISIGSPLSTSFAAFEVNLVLGEADLALDDVDSQVLATQESRDAVPDARGALLGIHATQRDERRGRRPGRLSRRVVRRAGGRLGQPDGVGMGGAGGSGHLGSGSSSGLGFVMPGRWGIGPARSTPTKRYGGQWDD